tara:strand:- start:827 stop:1348 length:522 start_codon:yes stop_codon:yes gene_type:complete
MNGKKKNDLYAEHYDSNIMPSRATRNLSGILRNVESAAKEELKPSKLEQGIGVLEALGAGFAGGSVKKKILDKSDKNFDIISDYISTLKPEMRDKFKMPTRYQMRLGDDVMSYGDWEFSASDLAQAKSAEVNPEIYELMNMMGYDISKPKKLKEDKKKSKDIYRPHHYSRGGK